MGPTCPTCQGRLTWYAAQNGWGCDRCRTMVNGMPNAMPQQASPVALPAAPAGPSKLPYAIAAAFVIVAAGIAIAIVIKRASLKKLDRDGLVRLTFAALHDGDAGKMTDHSAAHAMKGVIECTTESSEERRAFDEQVARATARLGGFTLGVTKIRAASEPKKHAKDEELSPGCKLLQPMVTHELFADVHLAGGGKAEDTKATLTVIEAGGRWYLATPPRIEGCDGAVDDLARSLAVTTGPADANKSQRVFLNRCLEIPWTATVTKCLEGSINANTARGCLTSLEGDQLVKLREDKALAAVRDAVLPDPNDKPTGAPKSLATAPVADSAGPIKVDDSLVPDAAPPDSATDKGEPEAADYGDFWLTERSDNSVRVSAPYMSAVFPAKPAASVEKSKALTADGKDHWQFQFSHDLGDDGQLRLEVSSVGRGAKDTGAEDPMLRIMANIGPVKRRKRDFKRVSYVDLEVHDAATGGSLRTLTIKDLDKGLVVVGIAATSAAKRAVGTRFLTSIEERFPEDPGTDPETLDELSTKKSGKKFAVTAESFSIELPWKPTVKRTPSSPGDSATTVEIDSAKGSSSIRVVLTQLGPWDGLQNHPAQQQALADEIGKAIHEQIGRDVSASPVEMKGLSGYKIEPTTPGAPRVESYSLWSRYLHRRIVVTCVDAPCEATLRSLTMPAFSQQ